MSVFKLVAKSLNALSVGAKTVNDPRGFVNTGSNSAVITAVVNAEKLLSIAISTTVSLGKITATFSFAAVFWLCTKGNKLNVHL